MENDNLEKRVKKAVLKIEKKVSEINNVMNDLSMKLCHLIRRKMDFYNYQEKKSYYQ